MPSRIGFDASDSESYSDDDTTFNQALSTRQTPRNNRAPPTPQTAPRSSVRSPRTPQTGRSSVNSSTASRSRSRVVDSPQPGPSRANNPPRPRKQPLPKKKKKEDNVLREIFNHQMSTKHLLPKLSFARVVREILQQNGDGGWKMQSEALEALQEATEMYVVHFMEDAYRCTIHRSQVTLTVKDMLLVRALRGPLL